MRVLIVAVIEAESPAEALQAFGTAMRLPAHDALIRLNGEWFVSVEPTGRRYTLQVEKIIDAALQ